MEKEAKQIAEFDLEHLSKPEVMAKAFDEALFEALEKAKRRGDKIDKWMKKSK